MHVYHAADVWTHGIDGSMRAEARGVDPQVGGALLNHIPDDVHLHLRKQAQCQSQRCYYLLLFIMSELVGGQVIPCYTSASRRYLS